MPADQPADAVSATAAVEVLAYLVSAARTQLDEAAEYAPMRLLTAAQLLADALPDGSSEPIAELVAAIKAIPPTATPTADRDAYVAMVDELCRVLAESLLALEAPHPDPSP